MLRVCILMVRLDGDTYILVKNNNNVVNKVVYLTNPRIKQAVPLHLLATICILLLVYHKNA